MAATEPAPADADQRLKYIMLALRRALLIVVAAIEYVYQIDPKERVIIIIEH